MKYNTLLVPVVAFAALTTALPSDPSGKGHGYPSDQGKYQSRPKALKQEQSPLQKVAGVPFQPPVNAPISSIPQPPVNPEAAVARVKGVAPFNEVPRPGSLPVPNFLPTNSLPSAPRPGFLPELPVEVPPKKLPPSVPGMRRSRTHVTRDPKEEVKCGRIVVTASDNTFSGFVSADMDEDGRYAVVKDASKGVLVDLNSHNLVFRNPDTYPALGATFGVMHDSNASQDNMQGNSANFAMLTGTSMTTYGKRDTDGSSSFNDATGASQKVESAIYYLGENRELHASWVNTNGQAVPIQFGVNPDYEVVMSANVGQYAATYGGKSARLFCSGQ